MKKKKSKNKEIFKIKDGCLLKYYGSDTMVQIPDEVKRINSWAFYNNNQMETVIIPQTVEYIEKFAFASCHKLKNVIFPEYPAIRVEKEAFIGSLWEAEQECIIVGQVLIEIRFPKDDIISIPEGVAVIGNFAFNESWYYDHPVKIKSFPKTLIEIRSFAFSDRSEIHCMYHDTEIIISPGSWNTALVEILALKKIRPYISDQRKYPLLWEMFFIDSSDLKIWTYLEEHFSEAINVLTDMHMSDMILKIFDCGEFFIEDHIDDCIQHAIATKNYEIQLMMMEYKNTHVKAQSTAEIIKNKFAL